MKLTHAEPAKQSGRWIWGTFFLLIVLPLYAIAVVLFVRSGLFKLNGGSFSNDQLKDVWTFLAAGLAASATILGALLTKSYNDRNLAAQNLNTVVSALGLISKNGQYSTKAATAAGLATLVQLGHPLIAMRALGPAFEDKAVDRDTFAWLISQVIISKTTVGTPQDLESAKEQAAALLRAFIEKRRLTDRDSGQFSWPDALTAQWPTKLSQNAAWNVMNSLAELLLSERKKWWRDRGASYTWIIYTLDEITRTDSDREIKTMAATLGQALLEVTDENAISGLNDSRSKSLVAKRMATQSGSFPDLFDPDLYERIQIWGRANPPP
jgi:hypothetical protein